jgi:hypothetical protein
MDNFHAADVHETSEEDDGQRSAVVFNELSHVSLEKSAISSHATQETEHKDEKRDGDGEVSGSVPGKFCRLF